MFSLKKKKRTEETDFIIITYYKMGINKSSFNYYTEKRGNVVMLSNCNNVDRMQAGF